jgi:hypothetical protein
LRGERPQQMRLAVDQIRQRLRAQRPSRKVGHPPLGIGNAARPPPRIAGAPLHETPSRVARTRQQGIRTKLLIFLDSRSGKQAITGRQWRIGNDFWHQRGSGRKRLAYTFTMCSHQGTEGAPTGCCRNGAWASRPQGLMRPRAQDTHKATEGRCTSRADLAALRVRWRLCAESLHCGDLDRTVRFDP